MDPKILIKTKFDHLECLNRVLDEYNSKYDNFVFIVDFNVNVNESSMKEFCNSNGLKSLINKPTCFKNPEKPSCIDLIPTNRRTYFQLSTVLQTGLSDFHLLTATEFKMGFSKSKPRIIIYRDYKKFNSNAFRSEIESLCSSEAYLGFFKDSILHIFNKHAPIKKKYLLANEVLFMAKEIHVAFMKRSRLRNTFLREVNQANRDNYKIERILCKKLLWKTINSYFSGLDTKKITVNITFWKKVVPLFRNKPSKRENVIINEGSKSISGARKLCQIFNTFFSNVAFDLNIPNPSNYFKEKKFYSISAIIEHFEKHRVSPISRIRISNLLFLFFKQPWRSSKSYPQFKYKKTLSYDRHSN